MANCGISSGLAFTCEEKQASAGGLKQDFYAGNIADLSSLSYDGNGNVNSINFVGYAGLYKFTGVKAKNTAGSDIQRGDGGLPFYPHELNLTLIDVTPAQKTALEDLANAETFWIVPTSSGRWEMYGADLGLEITSGVRNSGETPSANASRLITLSGDQPHLEKIVLIPDADTSTDTYAETKAALESYLA